MISLKEAIQDPRLQEVMARAQKMSLDKKKQQEEPGEAYNCPDCKDTGATIYQEEVERLDGKKVLQDFFKPCQCAEKAKLRNRYKNSLIPDEFESASFKEYERNTEVQKTLFNATFAYMKQVQDILTDKPDMNSLGFIAEYGETTIREMAGSERYAFKQDHNSFGLGKTHLQMALARYIMEKVRLRDRLPDGSESKQDRGCRVLCISDVTFMEDLIQAKMAKDEGKKLKELVTGACEVDVLVWDDMGKSKWSEAKEGLYYQIINERWRHKRPIIFSSNEDRGTLSDKIGYAAASRLFGMTGEENLYEVEGADYRLKRGESNV